MSHEINYTVYMIMRINIFKDCFLYCYQHIPSKFLLCFYFLLNLVSSVSFFMVRSCKLYFLFVRKLEISITLITLNTKDEKKREESNETCSRAICVTIVVSGIVGEKVCLWNWNTIVDLDMLQPPSSIHGRLPPLHQPPSPT
jgi:hypothetical protein